ncbi:MAG: hypothetical protein ACI3VQ_02800 [Faecousia sp.]
MLPQCRGKAFPKINIPFSAPGVTWVKKDLSCLFGERGPFLSGLAHGKPLRLVFLQGKKFLKIGIIIARKLLFRQKIKHEMRRFGEIRKEILWKSYLV